MEWVARIERSEIRGQLGNVATPLPGFACAQPGLRPNLRAYSFARIPANFSRTLATSSGLARATGGKSLSRSNGRQASITARELVELALSRSGSRGVDQARRKNSISAAGSQRVHTAHITSKISVGSTSSSSPKTEQAT